MPGRCCRLTGWGGNIRAELVLVCDLLSVVLHPLPADTPVLPAHQVHVVPPAVAGLAAVEAPDLLQLRHLQENNILSLSFTPR